MTGRNSPCPCGSRKKFKRCYGLQDPACTQYMNENRREYIGQHDAREKEVVSFLMGVMEECNTVFFKNDKGITPIPQRIQTIVAFSLIDVLGSYLFGYLDRKGSPSERFKLWYDEFCINTNNPSYKGMFTEIDSERMYRFRNALVHFFGMGDINDEDIFIALAANDLADSDKEKMEKAFAQRGHKTIMLRPKDFFDLVREGVILMMNGWKDVIQSAQTDRQKEKEHIEGIERVWAKIQSEGAKGVSRKQAGLPV